jgi:hypothetical protein
MRCAGGNKYRMLSIKNQEKSENLKDPFTTASSVPTDNKDIAGFGKTANFRGYGYRSTGHNINGPNINELQINCSIDQ